MQDSKNLVLAIVLCLAILFGWGRLAEYMGWVQKPDPAVVAQQQEAVRFVAAHGGRIGLGSDAGAWHVMHGQAIPDELGYLTAALGPRTEPLLLEAEAYASVTFCRK